MKKEIKAIIFDYGGVLSVHGKFHSICIKYAIKLNKNPLKFIKLVRENWNKAKVNKINSKLFWEKLADSLGEDAEFVRKQTMDYFGFREDVFNLIKKLKKNYKIALLSNQIEDWLEEVIKEKNFKEVFDVIVTSYQFKIAKPDIRIFKETIKKLGVKPEECIYIDDLKKNRPPVKELGMKFILFKNYSQLKKELKKLSIII